MRRIGLLRTPEETSPPAVVERSNALAAELAVLGAIMTTRCRRSGRTQACGPRTNSSFLAEAPRRRRGDVDVETAVAAAKLNDAQTLEDARAWLNSRERLAVLNDRALIAMLARLPSAAAQANATAQPNAA